MSSKELLIIVLAILAAGCIIAGAVFISSENIIKNNKSDNLTNESSNITNNTTNNTKTIDTTDYSEDYVSNNQKIENEYHESEFGIPEGASQEEVDAYILGGDYDAYGSSSGMSRQEYIDYYSKKASQ